MKSKFLLIFVFVLSIVVQSFADVKIKQRITVEGQGSEQTTMIKGARERRETKIITGKGDDNQMAEFMPSIATITQCDLRRSLRVNDKKKLYAVDPFNGGETVSNTAPQKNVNTRKGGLMTITFTVTDTGERKTMFGLQARHLKVLQMMESSADSCSGASKSKIEIDAWYADFSADFNCPIDLPDGPPVSKPDCRDRIVYKKSGTTKLGFLLDGTMTVFDANGKAVSNIRTETLEISRSPLDISFFDVGKDYREVSDSGELYTMPSMAEIMAMAEGRNKTVSTPNTTGKKYLGLDFFTGNSSKINQDIIRRKMSENLIAEGFATSLVTSPNEVSNGRFDYVIGVNIINLKQSKAAKIGGLFGKVTGDTGAAKIGDSEAEVVVTVYQKDGKTIVAQQTAKQKISGSPDEAAAAAIENALENLIGKIR